MSKGKCVECDNETDDGIYCDSCFDEMRQQELQRIRITQWDSFAPALYEDARLEHLSGGLVTKLVGATGGAVVWGPVGVGKTYAMFALMRKRIACGIYDIKRIKYDMLCLEIRATYDGAGNEIDVIKRYQDYEILWIEDLGTTVSVGEQESDFSLRIFLLILDKRLEEQRPTFITTNKDLEGLGRSFDARIASRLRTLKVIAIGGEDRREIQSAITDGVAKESK